MVVRWAGRSRGWRSSPELPAPGVWPAGGGPLCRDLARPLGHRARGGLAVTLPPLVAPPDRRCPSCRRRQLEGLAVVARWAGPSPGWNVWRPGWSGLADQKQVATGLDLLAELGHLEVWQEPTRTKPRTLYIVNPKSAPPAGVRH